MAGNFRDIRNPAVIRIHVLVQSDFGDTKKDTTVSIDDNLYAVASLTGIDVYKFCREEAEKIAWGDVRLKDRSLSRYLQGQLLVAIALKLGHSYAAIQEAIPR